MFKTTVVIYFCTSVVMLSLNVKKNVKIFVRCAVQENLSCSSFTLSERPVFCDWSEGMIK